MSLIVVFSTLKILMQGIASTVGVFAFAVISCRALCRTPLLRVTLVFDEARKWDHRPIVPYLAATSLVFSAYTHRKFRMWRKDEAYIVVSPPLGGSAACI